MAKGVNMIVKYIMRVVITIIISCFVLFSCSDNEFDKAMKEAKQAEKKYKEEHKNK
jgi:type III secretory pathway component EscU